MLARVAREKQELLNSAEAAKRSPALRYRTQKGTKECREKVQSR